MLEASMFGKPLITSDIRGSGMSDINRDGVTGLTFQNLSSESLASKVNSLLFSPARSEELGAAARQNFVQSFSDENLPSSINLILDTLRKP